MPSSPVQTIRYDNVVVRIDRRQTRDGIRYSVTINRVYLNGDVRKQSTRCGRNDLPVIRAALDEAFTWILENSGGGTQQLSTHT